MSDRFWNEAVSRRRALVGSGALVVWFSLAACASQSSPSAPAAASPAGSGATSPAASPAPAATAAATAQPTPASPATAVAQGQKIQQPTPTAFNEAQSNGPPNDLDSWLAIGADGKVTVFDGKVELGTGVETALSQIVAEELKVPFRTITMVMGDTARTPNEGYTAGSQTIQTSGPAVRKAAAEAYQLLLGMASQKLGAPVGQLAVKDGVVSASGSSGQSVSYGELVGGKTFNHVVPQDVPTAPPASYTIVGQSVPRVDLPAKLTAVASYVQDLRLPGMLHGRIVRPPGVGATLESVDEGSIQGVPGVVKVVRNGSFLGVVAQEEWQAIQAARQLKASWKVPGNLPSENDLASYITSQKTEDKTAASQGDVDGAMKGAVKTLQATYQQPYQAHASIGPSCAVADVNGSSATIYSSTQGVYPLRGALAQLLNRPDNQVRVVYSEGAGCYGHNGFDDVSADAALLSQAVGKPVRVQWMRQDEFALEPKGPGMVMQVKAGLDAPGNVVAWDYQVWTPTHSTRPGGQAGNLNAGRLIQPPAPAAKNPPTGGDRNAPVNYRFANVRAVAHWLTEQASPLRPSALRSLGGFANTFANESFMDELAAATGQDAVAFRLKHLADPRAIAVVQAAAKLANWQTRPSPAKSSGSGRGISFLRYENKLTYVACVAEVTVDRGTGRVSVQRLSVAHDCGLVVNPNGLQNQIEGNCLQAMSRALKERVSFDQNGVTSLDWRGYPILTFPEVPDVQIQLLDHPDQPAWGAGEPTTEAIPAAIANAVFDASGARVRALPMTAARVKAALGPG